MTRLFIISVLSIAIVGIALIMRAKPFVPGEEPSPARTLEARGWMI